MSVKVAVRVRPFNSREKELGCKLSVEMSGATTVLINPEDNKKRDFTFDYSFWSHDEFEEDAAGYYVPLSNKYADQRKVFDLVGKEVLDNAWQGYHCCLFAYGQTGAGKSYSMVGYGANKGIVPISMQDIFTRIGKNTDPSLSFEVSFSMLEIYNERIQDLLVPVKERPNEGLKVREHQKYGVYVEGLTKHPVDSYKTIESKMEEGSKNRTIGSTMMNACSSRAHTIMCIEFKRIEIIDKKKTERFSVINLVDLAGSEKISKTGATGDRLKEGCSINKSLSTLGLVISKLADKAMGKKNAVVPYRDSALTRILQNALGGNSKTLMICAISPASDNYEETLSTLRYADQAKKIKNNAIINESEQDKMIRELKEENEKLKAMLKDFKPESNVEGYRMIDEETLNRFKEMEEQLKANAAFMHDYEKTFQEKLAEAKAKEHDDEPSIDKTKPYLMNLNEDPLLSGKVLHSLNKERVIIGKKNGDPVPDIILGGIGIKPNHALIMNYGDKITISPYSPDCGDQLFVNGNKVLEEREIYHNDRIIIGTNSIFMLKYSGKENDPANPNHGKDEVYDWEFAQTELIDTIDQEKNIKHAEQEIKREQEVQQKIKEIEEKYQREKKEKEETLIKQQIEYENKLKEIEENMKRETEQQKVEMEKKEAEKEWKEQFARYEAERLFKERERERMQKEVQEEATLQRYKEQEKMQLEHKLAKHLAQITEVNLIAKELNRDINFAVKLAYNFVSGAELQLFGHEKSGRTKIQIMVNNRETNNQYIWSMSKFTNRYFIIKDLLEQHYEGSKLPERNTQEDPFWDPPEAHVVGQGFLCLEAIGYLLDNPADLTIVGDNGPIGKLAVNVYPTYDNGEPLGDNADLIDDPNELLDKRLDFAVQITSLEIQENLYQDVFCQYSLLADDGSTQNFKTDIARGIISKHEFNYIFHHTIHCVNKKVLNYILNHNLRFQVCGSDIVEEKSNSEQLEDESLISQTPDRILKEKDPLKEQQLRNYNSKGPNVERPTEKAGRSMSVADTTTTIYDQENRNKNTLHVNEPVVNIKQTLSPNHFESKYAMNSALVKNMNALTQANTQSGAQQKKKGTANKDDKECNMF